ncbi:hypothetical protein [Gracilibacillus sp. JCM 18860]|uniref:hypothetical protein n=1 Tax=Gracilibacillus sp. JCM 18860 TaxID=1306159 RepID=UPI003261A7AF
MVCFLYGILYYFVVRDTPPKGKKLVRPKRTAALEVSSWGDLIQLMIWTLPLGGAVAISAWRLEGLGFISKPILYVVYTVILIVLFYQLYTILKINIPILKKGVPKEDRYKFRNVVALNSTYFANFGAELAIVSMLPMFFQLTFSLSAAQAGSSPLLSPL